MPEHLIHIGFPKAASTFLQEWFRLHPELHFSQDYIAGFQNTFDICRFSSDINGASPKYFVTSSESFAYPHSSTGKLTAANLFTESNIETFFLDTQKKLCETLKNLFPNGKILIITRGFKGIMKSSYSQYIKTGGTLNFSEFCEFTSKNIGVFYNYDYIIDLYIKNFGRRNVSVVPFELLLENNQTLISHLENILGLNHFDIYIGKKNKSMPDQKLYWYSKISTLISVLLQKFGTDTYNRIYPKYAFLLQQNKFRFFFKTLSLFVKNKSYKKTVPKKILHNAGKNATILKEYPIYTPFLKDYYLPNEA